MSQDYSSQEFVDIFDEATNEWVIGKVMSKISDKDQANRVKYRVRILGKTSADAIEVDRNSKLIAPFRLHTKCFPNSVNGRLENSSFDLTKVDDILELFKKFRQKNYDKKMDASFINAKLRGEIYFFIRDLFLGRSLKFSTAQLSQLTEFFKSFIEFLVIYLGNFQNMIEQFEEGIRDQKTILSQPNVAYTQFIFEVFEILTQLFGHGKEYGDFFTHKIDKKRFENFQDSDSNEPAFLRENTEHSRHSQSDWGDPVTYNEHESSFQKFWGDLTMNQFATQGGFSKLTEIIYGVVVSFSKSSQETIEPRALTPLKLVQQIIKFFDHIYKSFNDEYQESLFKEIRTKTLKRLESTSLKEIQKTEFAGYKSVYEQLNSLFQNNKVLNENQQLERQFYKEKEISELKLCLKFLENSKVERKLDGLKEIILYKTRIQNSMGEWIDNEKLHYWERRSFIDWILDQPVFSLIYRRCQSVELIKRSLELLKFIAQDNEIFPEKLIQLLCDSCKSHKDQDILQAIYDNILELPPYLKFEVMTKFLEYFYEFDLQYYEEGFVKFICRFVKQCLEDEASLTAIEKNNLTEKKGGAGAGTGVEIISLQITKMFELSLDPEENLNTLASFQESQYLLFYISDLLKDHWKKKYFLKIATSCFANVKEKKSVYQSLIFLEEFMNQLMKNSEPATIEKYFENLFVKKNSIESLICAYESYYAETRNHVKEIKSKKGRQINQEKDSLETYVGKFPHKPNVVQVLNCLKLFIVHQYSTQPLSFEQVKRLWKVFVTKANFDFESKLFLELISQRYENWGMEDSYACTIWKDDDMKKIFSDIICEKNFFGITKITPEKFKCFEFFFTAVNVQEGSLVRKTITRGQQTEKITVKDPLNLIGIKQLWNYYLACSDESVLRQFTQLLVRLHTNYDITIKEEKETMYQNTLKEVFELLERCIANKAIKEVERYIEFLESFFDAIENKGDQHNLKRALSRNHHEKAIMKVNVKYYPYEITKQLEFDIHERLGFIKTQIAHHFELNQRDFELVLDNEMIQSENFDHELKDYEDMQNILILKQNHDPEFFFSNYSLLAKNKYTRVFFSLLQSFEPENVKKAWEFFKKIPKLQSMEQKIAASCDISACLQGITKIDNSNMFLTYYVLSIVQDLVLIDPYYWKMKQVILKKVKSEWAGNFVSSGGVKFMVELILKTDFQQINNFLLPKCCLTILQMLNFFFTAFEETRFLWSSQLFQKILDVLLYSSKDLVDSKQGVLDESAKDVLELFSHAKNILQNILRVQNILNSAFLLYPNLSKFLARVFVDLSDQDRIRGVQDNAFELLNEVFSILKNSSDQQNGDKIFRVLYEELIFTGLKSPKPSLFIIKYLAEFQKKHDLQQEFSCSLDLLNVMRKIVYYVREFDLSVNEHKEKKIEACYYMIKCYLSNNPGQLEQIGTKEELVAEILLRVFPLSDPNGNHEAKYESPNLITLALETLANLSKNEKNFEYISKFLMVVHKTGSWRDSNYSSWNRAPKAVKRRMRPYIGLKNLGSTCYMNSTVQQLFMIPSFTKSLLELQDSDFNQEDAENNCLFQLKKLFYAMGHIQNEFYNPKHFCISFKDLEGNPTNVHEQKDAFEFLCLLLDRIEDKIKRTKNPDIVKNFFGGSFLNEVICHDYSHSSIKEEEFLGVSLIIKDTLTIQESLRKFVETQVLDKDNSYFCEECQKKVKAKKKVSFKTLPKYLIFVLNRFEYDVGQNMRMKINDHFEFSTELDLEPFTYESIKRSEQSSQLESERISKMTTLRNFEEVHQKHIYDLKGFVIHKGGAESGHYYSVIKDYTSKDSTDPENEKWLEFNDTHVTEFDMKDLKEVAFGDTYWNKTSQSAYILVYKKKDIVEEFSETQPKTPLRDSLEFDTPMEIETPLHLKRDESCYKDMIRKKQKKLFDLETLFSKDYFKFIESLIINVEESGASKNRKPFKLFQLVWTIYITTILRAQDEDIADKIYEWLLKKIEKNDDICRNVQSYFVHPGFFREMVLQCPKQEARKRLVAIGSRVFKLTFQTERSVFLADPEMSLTGQFLCLMMNMLPITKYNLQSMGLFFSLLKQMMQVDLIVIKFLFEKELLGRLLQFFLNPQNQDELIILNPKYELPSRNFEYLEYDLPLLAIPFDPKQPTEPQPPSAKSFEDPTLTDLSKFFETLWGLLCHTITPEEKTKKFVFHKSGVNHLVTEPEKQLMDLSFLKIQRMFNYIKRNDRHAQLVLCKVISFLSLLSEKNLYLVWEFVRESLNVENSDKSVEDGFKLIRTLLKMKNPTQNKRLLDSLVSGLSRRSDNLLQLQEYTNFLQKCVKGNPHFRTTLIENENKLNSIIFILRDALNDDRRMSSSKPINFNVKAQVQESLTKLKTYFSDLKDGKIDYSEGDSGNELDPLPKQFQRGQKIEFMDNDTQISIRGVIDTVYGNILKVKIKTAIEEYYKFLDDEDESNIRFIDEKQR